MEKKEKEVVIGYKAYNKGKTCQPDKAKPAFQFEEGKTYKVDGEVEPCENGFHFCKLPFNVLNYYPLSVDNEYSQVEACGVVDSADKSACSEITIKQFFGLKRLIELQVEKVATTGYEAHSATTGYEAHSATTGYRAHSATTGYHAIACSLGINSRAKAEKSWIVISDWRYNDGQWNLNRVCTAPIGGEIDNIVIEPNTWYWFEDGVLKSEK